jgi:hypothetical protein
MDIVRNKKVPDTALRGLEQYSILLNQNRTGKAFFPTKTGSK